MIWTALTILCATATGIACDLEYNFEHSYICMCTPLVHITLQSTVWYRLSESVLKPCQALPSISPSFCAVHYLSLSLLSSLMALPFSALVFRLPWCEQLLHTGLVCTRHVMRPLLQIH